MNPDRTPLSDAHVARVERARGQALLSAIVPGLGQATQRRYGAAVIQFGTAAAYVAVALGLGDRRALLLGLAWNVWSVFDAYRREAD